MSADEPTRRPLHVAMVCDWFYYYAAALAGGLAADDQRVLMVTRDHGLELGIEGDASPAKRSLLADSVALQLVRGAQRNPASLFSAIRAARVIRRFRPDVLHVQDHSDWRLALVQMLAPDVPVVTTLHDVQMHLGATDFRNAVQKLVSRWLLGASDAFVVHGKALEGQLREQPWYRGQPIAVIEHGVLGEPGSVPLPEVPRVLFFGRLEKYKGLDVFVRACELAAQRVPELRAVIAGRGSEEDSARGLVANGEVFEWRTGFVPDADVPGLFDDAMVVALPYVEASQSGVIPLAFERGRAVIASRVGALPEVVDEGRDGLLVPPGDVEALADAIVELVTDRGRLEVMSGAALEKATTGALSQRAVARKHVEFYARLIGRPHA